MNAAFERDKEISNKLDEQLEQVGNFRESVSLPTLLLFAKTLLGENHLLLVILNSVLLPVLILPELLESDIDDEADDPQQISRYKLLKRTSADGVDNSLGGSEVLVEGSKAIGQSIGFSAAFLAWDALDLGMNVSDLVHKQGSEAARVLRGKAAVLESALQSTLELYSVEIPE